MSGEIEKEKKGRKKVSEIHREKEDRRREREREKTVRSSPGVISEGRH